MKSIDPAADLNVTPKEIAPVAMQQSNLKLDDEQMEELRYRCEQRIKELMTEMGLDADGSVQADSWMGMRKVYQDSFDNDASWRAEKYGGVFEASNLTLGTAHRFVRETHSKASDDLLGTRPFFTALKTESGDGATARAVEELIQQKMDRSDIQLELRSAIRSALIRNECTTKIRYIRRSTPYFSPATVMVDTTTREPVISPNGLLIYEDDDFLPDPNVEGMFRLKKDPLFVMTEGQFAYQRFSRLQQELIEYEGVEVRELDYRSFLCPLRCPSIHEADFCAQLYDDTPANIRKIYGKFEGFDEYWSGLTTSEISGEKKAKETHGERDEKFISAINVYRSMAECYVRMDPDGNGEVEIFAVFDRNSSKLIYAEYLANVMPKRPFEVIPGVAKVQNRWYGEGVIQAIIDQNTYIDAQFNRFNVKDGNESSVTFRDPNACREWKQGQQVEFGTDKVYDSEPGYDDKNRPPIWRVNLQEKSEIGMELMHEAMQQTNLMFGVIGAKDASASDLNQSRTATGILNIERTSNLLIKNTEIQQQAAIVRVIEQCVTLILENIRDTELLLSKDGKQLLTINRDEARSINREIRLLLTRSRSSELLTTNQQALGYAKDYHALRGQAAPQARDLRRLYIASLKALEVPDPDELCPPVTDEDIEAWKERMSTTQKAELKRTSREMIAYKDCPPSVQAQWEQECGWEPASPEERMQHMLMMNPPKPEPAAATASKKT